MEQNSEEQKKENFFLFKNDDEENYVSGKLVNRIRSSVLLRKDFDENKESLKEHLACLDAVFHNFFDFKRYLGKILRRQ